MIAMSPPTALPLESISLIQYATGARNRQPDHMISSRAGRWPTDSRPKGPRRASGWLFESCACALEAQSLQTCSPLPVLLPSRLTLPEGSPVMGEARMATSMLVVAVIIWWERCKRRWYGLSAAPSSRHRCDVVQTCAPAVVVCVFACAPASAVFGGGVRNARASRSTSLVGGTYLVACVTSLTCHATIAGGKNIRYSAAVSWPCMVQPNGRVYVVPFG